MLKTAIIFLFGAAAGATAAAFFTKRFVEKKFDRISGENKELKEYLDFLRQKDEMGNLAENLGYVEKEGEELKEKEAQDQSKGKNKEKKVDYTAFYNKGALGPFGDMMVKSLEEMKKSDKEFELSKKIAKEQDEKMKKERDEYNKKLGLEDEHPVDSDEDDDSDEPEYDYELEKAIRMLNNGKKKIDVISAGEFDSYPYHDKVTLYYYTEDQILATEDEEELDDPEAYLGDALTKTGFDSNDSEALYVRNYSRGTDYEIGKVFGAFNE